jgi:hypothetical protein
LQHCASTFEDQPSFKPNNVSIHASKFPRGDMEARIRRAEAEASAKWTGAKGVKAPVLKNRADQLAEEGTAAGEEGDRRRRTGAAQKAAQKRARKAIRARLGRV